jgi:mono/diheme cytochrome c family protein
MQLNLGMDRGVAGVDHRRTGCRYGQSGLAFLAAMALNVPVFAATAWQVLATNRAREAQRASEALALQAHERLIAATPLPMVGVEEAAHGRDLFLSTCAACHGPDAGGMTGLGKTLVESDFVARLGDDELVRFLVLGRPLAQPIPMPPKAGREDLSDGDLRHIVAYVRGIQDPRRLPALPPPKVVAGPVSEDEKAQALVLAGGDTELAGYIASGNKLFHQVCIACHGKGGVGIQGNGKALVGNEFIKGLDDDAMLAFLMRGRNPGEPLNTTGVQMPPKGGNPALSEDDLLDIISYLRTLGASTASASSAKTK